MDSPAIIAQAEDIARQFNPEGLSPFPYQKIQDHFKELNIYLVEDLSPDISGGIGFDESGKFFKIFVNKSKALSHQNFVTAHELGHFFLHSKIVKETEVLIDKDPLVLKSSMFGKQLPPERMQIELEANNFALALLMPEELMIQVWEELRDIEECAHVFNVSSLAMSVRLKQVGLME